MEKLILYFIFLISISLKVTAQPKIISGYLLDSITHFAVYGGTITNASTKKSAHSDLNGFFRIEASPNNFLYATAKSYRYDTLVYSYLFTDTISIFLSPAGNILPNVTVTTRYNKYQLDSIERKTSFENDLGKPAKTLSTDHPSGFGITFNLDKVFKKQYKYRKRNEQMFNVREKLNYVDYRFSPQIVAYYSGLKGDALKSFLQQNTPDYNWLRQNQSNEAVMYYINNKLKEYKAKQGKPVN